MQAKTSNSRFSNLPSGIAIVMGFAILLCSNVAFAQRVTNINAKGTKLTTGNTVTEAATAPTSPAPIQGDIWLDTTANLTKVWDGSAWKPIESSTAFSLWDTDIDTGIQVEEGADDDTIRFDTNGTERMVIDSDGDVGIGTPGPTQKLDVNGTARVRDDLQVDGAAYNDAAFDAGAGTTIDFSQSNLAYTTANSGAFTLTNLKNGGTYTLAVQGTASGTATFSATGFTFLSNNNGATDAGQQTLYTFLVIGTTVYFNMHTGY